MALTIGIALGVGLTALLGLLRGVRAGLVAVVGTLLAAVLVDLWAGPLSDWLRATIRPERPAAPTFVVVAAAFIVAAAMFGYGGPALLPRAGADVPGPLGRLIGALLGALNGALLAGYLLRYALESWDGGPAAAAVAGSAIAGLLVAWLPWYMLGIAGALGALILLRLWRRLAHRLAATHSTGHGSVSTAPTLAEADRRLSDKIDRALRK